ncbi:MAG TPA: hypothetical protein VFE78_02225, partial [Gemmataceae bacterium]|nr:hypothetical protein [Gemmataceae bacterium]
HGGHLPFPLLPPDGCPCGVECRVMRDPVQPVRDHSFWHDGRGLASEDEKRGLEGVLGILMVGQDAAAYTPDHRAMPPHKGREGACVPLFDEAAEEFPIGRSRLVLLQDNSTKMLDGISRHRSPSTRLSSAFRQFICRRVAI